MIHRVFAGTSAMASKPATSARRIARCVARAASSSSASHAASLPADALKAGIFSSNDFVPPTGLNSDTNGSGNPANGASSPNAEASLSYVPAELIRKKREGKQLTESEINWFVHEFADDSASREAGGGLRETGGGVRDYQMSSFLMAVCLKGMNEREAWNMTRAMMATGEIRDLPASLSHRAGKRCVVVDKHSTGGVGDKVSLVAVPLAASLGMYTPHHSSRSLGHTGGTVDKFESIPGVRTSLDPEELETQLMSVGCAIVSPNASVSPIENRVYALRDTSGSVESPSLIASSIMSKKLATSPDCLLLDVKIGKGAFTPNLKDAVSLARMMVSIGENAGVHTRAVISNMEQPLGEAVGNMLEVREAVDVLDPTSVQRRTRESIASLREVRDLAVTHVAAMLVMSGEADTYEEAKAAAEAKLDDGSALDVMMRMVEAQNGDVKTLINMDAAVDAGVKCTFTLKAPRDGRVRTIDAYKCGMASLALGSGRLHADDPIDPFAGLILHAKVGALVAKDDPLVTVNVGHCHLLGLSPETRLARGARRAAEALTLTHPQQHHFVGPLVLYVVDKSEIYSFDGRSKDLNRILA